MSSRLAKYAGGAALVLQVALAATGCRETSISLVELPSPSTEYFFFVALDGVDRPTRTSAVFGVEAGRLTFGGSPSFDIRPEDRAILIIGLSKLDLSAIHAGFDLAREADLNVRSGDPPTSPRLVITGDAFVETALPANSAIAEATRGRVDNLDELAAKVRLGLILSVPVDPEYCRLENVELTPFGAAGELLPPERKFPGVVGARPDTYTTLGRVSIIDRDRALTASSHFIFIVHRGQIIPDPVSFDPFEWSDAILIDEIERGAKISTLAFDRVNPRPDGTIRVLAGGEINERPRIWDLELSARGIRFISTATIPRSLGDSTQVDDVAFDDRGNAVAVGPKNLILVRTATSTSFTQARVIEETFIIDYRRVVATHDPTRPHFIAEATGALYLGDALTGRWDTFHRTDRLNDLDYEGLGVSPDSAEFWAVGPKGAVFRRDRSERWTRVTPAVPPRFYPCAGASDINGEIAFTRDTNAVAIDATAAYLLTHKCSALLRLRRADLCASVVSVRGRDITTVGAQYHALDHRGGMLLMSGANGAMYTVDLPQGTP